MIIFSLCNSCLQPYQILVEASDVPLIKQIADENGQTAPCPRLCGGAITLVGDPTVDAMARDPRLREPLQLSGKELYQAVNGLGLPDEIPKNQDIVVAMLKAHPVSGVMTDEQHGKIYLHEIRLEGGITLHLGSGSAGAQVLKITKERRPDGSGNPG